MKVLRKGITELKDVTITHVSYVKRGANKKTFLLAKSEAGEPDVEFDVKVLMKDDAEKKLLYGIVYEPGAVDAHGDTMNAEEIEKMAHEFMAHYRAIDKEHNLIAGAGSVVESYIVPTDSIIGNTTVKAGSWMLVTKASQEIWDDYLNGEITGYSMYGVARQSIAKTEPETPDVGWVQKMMEKAGIIKSFQETFDSEIERIKRRPGFIIDMMSQEFWKNIDWGTESNEQLIALAESMEGAVKYIREITEKTNDDTQESVSKNDDETVGETVEETVDESNPIIDENIIVEKTDDATATSDGNDLQEKEQDLILDLEKIKAEVNQLKEENEKLVRENEEVVKSLEEKNQEIEKLMVRSNFQTTIQDNLAPAEPKPRLF